MTNEEFPLEKILTASPSEYCISKKTELEDYELVGIHLHDEDTTQGELIKEFAKKIPKEAEIVTNLLYSSVGSGIYNNYISGTALVPKNKK